MEVRGKRPLLVALAKLCYRRGWPQNTRCVKQSWESRGVHHPGPGAQNQPRSAPSVQRGTGAARAGPLPQGAAGTQPEKHLSHRHGDREPCRDVIRRTRIWLAHKQGRLSPPRAGLESLPPIFNIFNCSQSRGGCKAGASPCSAHRAAPSHCPQTMNLPEPSCLPGSSSAADRCKSCYPSAWDSGTAGMRGVSVLALTEVSTCNVLPLSRDNPPGVSEFVSVRQIQATELRTHSCRSVSQFVLSSLPYTDTLGRAARGGERAKHTNRAFPYKREKFQLSLQMHQHLLASITITSGQFEQCSLLTTKQLVG